MHDIDGPSACRHPTRDGRTIRCQLALTPASGAERRARSSRSSARVELSWAAGSAPPADRTAWLKAFVPLAVAGYQRDLPGDDLEPGKAATKPLALPF